MRMYGISRFFNGVYSSFANVDGDFLIALDLGAFALLFIIILICTLTNDKIRRADKKPFFHLLNLFTAITAAVFLTCFEIKQALLFCCLFWPVGYVLYGILCALSKRRTGEDGGGGVALSRLNVQPPMPPAHLDVPAAKSAVRLEHALSICEKLSKKALGKGDRQELEKMKTTLSLLHAKEQITPQEGEILNDIFNTILKLMAKYNL